MTRHTLSVLVEDQPGVAATLFTALADALINVDTILQNVVHGVAELSFSVPTEDVQAARNAIEDAKAELDRWFQKVYLRPGGAGAGDVYGTPEQVREQLEELIAAGANHLLVNPTGRYIEQVDALAEVVGLQ